MSHGPFRGQSEMARRMRALDWARTPIGKQTIQNMEPRREEI